MSIFLLPELTYDRAPLLEYALKQTNWYDNPIMPGVFSSQWGEHSDYIDPVFHEIINHFTNALHIKGCQCPVKNQGLPGCKCIDGCTPRIVGAAFMKIKSNWTLQKHTDPGRYAGVNCPITNSLKNSGIDIYDRGVVVSKVYTDCPYIIDTHSPHGAHNISVNEDNVFLSLTFNKDTDIDFTQLVDWQLKGELLQ